MLVPNYATSHYIQFLFNVVRNGHYYFEGEGKVGQSPKNIISWTEKKMGKGSTPFSSPRKIHAQPNDRKKIHAPDNSPAPIKMVCP